MQRPFAANFIPSVLIAVLACMAWLVAPPYAMTQSAPSIQSEAKSDGGAHIPAFDVTSVRQGKPRTIAINGGTMMMGPTFQFTADGFRATNISILMLASRAYGFNDFKRIKGLPGWATAGDAVFDISAKVSDADIPSFQKLSPDERSAMLQALLKERFHLAAHRAAQDTAVYAMVIAKGGSKMKEATQQSPATTLPNGVRMTAPTMGMGPYAIKANSGTTDSLAKSLEFKLGRPVVDRTGLQGKYDFVLDWKPDDESATQPGDHNELIFTAIRDQLGLALEPTHAPVEYLFIDHVEKPSEN